MNVSSTAITTAVLTASRRFFSAMVVVILAIFPVTVPGTLEGRV
jgi:hypothetical protein